MIAELLFHGLVAVSLFDFAPLAPFVDDAVIFAIAV
jgi:hypothetical protein